MSEVVVIPLRVQDSVLRSLIAVEASVWIVPDTFVVPAEAKAEVVRYSTCLDVRFQIPELAAAHRAASAIERLPAGVAIVHAPVAEGILYLAGRNLQSTEVSFRLHGEPTKFEEAWIDRARAILLHMEKHAAKTVARSLPISGGNTPTVSAVIPVFNLYQFLDQAIDSLIAQTRKVDEILVVDDGSDDPQTVYALKKLEKAGNNIRVLRKPHTGLSATRNFGIQAATSRYILTLDADDCLRPTFVERALERYQRDDSLVLATSMVSCFSGDVCDHSGGWCPLGFDRDLITVYNFASCATAIMPRNLLLELGGYDETFAAYEDWELCCRLARRGNAAIIPEFLIDVRIRSDSMLRTLPRMTHELLRARIIEKHAELAHDLGLAMRLLQGEYVEFYRGVVADPSMEARELVQSQLRYRLADKVNESLKKLGVQRVIKKAGEEWSQRS